MMAPIDLALALVLQLAVVMNGENMLGVISLSDIIRRVLPNRVLLAAGE